MHLLHFINAPEELESVHTHNFKLKPFKKVKSCDVCQQAITKDGLICKVCKLGIHKKCEVKVRKPWNLFYFNILGLQRRVRGVVFWQSQTNGTKKEML
ncbi:SH3 and cysteine-rich domain-containing protein 3-like, partial [Salmo trutta]|uniref:SH3 and cysteine-rich domain-containing protein 3-like n=1 Tax=Salmo trutta TaxID=8032 RepID=UPI001130163F